MIATAFQLSLRNRVLVAIFSAAIVAGGLYLLKDLPVDAVPDITNVQVQINTVAPALSPVEVEKQVTFPIETALAGMPGLESTRSLSRNGLSQVTAIFADKTDIYFARAQVNERLGEAKDSLPPNIEPRMGAITTGLGEIYMWTVGFAAGKRANDLSGLGPQPDGSYLTPEHEMLRSELEKASYLRTVEDWIIRPQLKTVPGVAGIDAIGGYVRQYNVEPDPQKLAAYGLGLKELSDALTRNNRSIGAGYIEKNGSSLVVRADGRIRQAADIGNIVVALRHNAPIRVRDVAETGIGKELRTGSASSNGADTVVGTALMLIGANSRNVSQAVDAKLAQIATTLPPGIEVKTVLDRTRLVKRTIATVQKNLLEGAALVIAVLFFALGSARAAIITALVIPISMLMTFACMTRLGLSANLMSLGALDFGLIVDGAIIVTESCLHRLGARQAELGRGLTIDERCREIAAAGRDVAQPILFGQAIIIMVFVPMLTFTGVQGKMFEPMALTVIIALVSAFLLSITFVPAMLALFMTKPVKEDEGVIVGRLKSGYDGNLSKALKRPALVIGGCLALFVLAAIGSTFLGQEFIPTLDEGDVAVNALRVAGTSLSQSQDMQFMVEKTISSFPEVELVYSKTGTAEMASDPMPPNSSDTFIILKPRAQWPDTSVTKAELISRLEAALAKLPGNTYEFTQPIQMRFNELIAGVRGDVAIKIYGDDFEQMGRAANNIRNVLQGIRGASDTKVEQVGGLPVLEIEPNRAAVARFGLDISDVLQTIAIGVGGEEAGLIFQGDRRFDVVVRLADRYRLDQRALEGLPLLLPASANTAAEYSANSYVPLREVAQFQITEGPNQISRENGKRRIVIQTNVRGRDMGSFVAEAKDKVASQVKLPVGSFLEWGGQIQNLRAASERLMVVVPLCLCAILLLLFMALGSFKQALLVFSGIPLAVIGGVATLLALNMPFSISAGVGFIALSGIAVLNGLVMVTSINQLIRSGNDTRTAVREGPFNRLRAMVIATLVPTLGYIPMALSHGAGAEVQRPLALVVIGGLITSTALTLFLLPVLYDRYNLGRSVHA